MLLVFRRYLERCEEGDEVGDKVDKKTGDEVGNKVDKKTSVRPSPLGQLGRTESTTP
jgi:hypothetical protein